MKRVVVIPDLQVPLHDPKATEALMWFIRDWQPDELYCVGDEADQFEISRWDKGTAVEYAGSYQKNLDMTHDIMAAFQEAAGGVPFHVSRSNHGITRIKSYLRKWAPALDSIRELEYERLLRYDEIGVTHHRTMWEFAKGWVLAHGDEGSANQTPGGTGMALAKRIGKSVVCGHTHKAGLQHSHQGFGGRITQPLQAMEVGHLMDMAKAKYLPAGHGNWQQAFGLLHIDKNTVHPQLVQVQNKSFVVEGQHYSW